MQKKLIALAVAGLASTAAFAQSNVQIYGVADVGYAYSFGGGQGGQHDILSGGLSGSRIGFTGTEDLGNGLKAVFKLEYGVDIDGNTAVGAGAAGARTQMLALAGGFGTVAAGRLQTAGYDYACGTSPIGGSALDANNKLGVGAGASVLVCGGAGRANNAVAYISPNFSGFTFAYNHARIADPYGGTAAEQAASSTTKDSYANLLTADYNAGPLNAKVVYSRADVALVNASQTEWGVSANYNFGVATVYGAVQTVKVKGDGLDLNRNEKWSLAVAVPVSAAGTFVAQYAGNSIDSNIAAPFVLATTGNNLNNASSSAYTLAYTHALSKRTTAYGGYTYVQNDSAATRAAGFQTVTAGKDPSVLAVGLRHTF
jgi:predicted porin